MTTTQPNKKAAWIAATRPRVFVASFVPMGDAAAVALQDGVMNWFYFILSLIGVMALQTTANLVNEYADFQRGTDDLKVAGQGMAIQKGLTPREVLWAAIAVTLLGGFIGLFLLFQSGIWLLAIGLGGVLVAITYTAGPFPLAYHGLGEVAAGIFMGPMIVIGAYYVMAPDLTAQRGFELALISFPVMFTTAAILHANNIRDMDADRVANKHTLAVRFGLRIARIEYMVLIAVTYLSQIVLVLVGLMPILTLLSWLSLPRARVLVKTFNTETDPMTLHKAQGQTAQLHGMFGLLMVVGWLIALVIA
jgi:1,4-dihydroxy-2-naphthoate octaprenyltransferase